MGQTLGMTLDCARQKVRHYISVADMVHSELHRSSADVRMEEMVPSYKSVYNADGRKGKLIDHLDLPLNP